MALPLLFIVGQALVRAATPAIASAIRSQGGRAVKKLTKALTKKYGQPKTMSKPPKITAKLGQNKTTGTSVTKPSGSGGNVTKPKSTAISKPNKSPKKKVFEGEVIPPKKNVSTKVNTSKRKGETIEGTTNKPLKVGGASKLKTLASVTAQIAADKLGTKSGVKSTNLSASEMPKPRPKKSKKTSVNKTPNYAGSRGIPTKKTPDYAGSRGIPKKSAVDTSKIKKPKKTEKVKKTELKKVVKKSKSNISNSSSYDAQFTYDELKKRGGEKFAKGRMSAKNYAKAKKK
tara:strand:- start:135 stop:995 length:861 start_codon:yes stop_codon:yes gene_type:complete